MQWLLDQAARAVRHHPLLVLASIAVITVGAAVASTQVVTQVEVEQFAPRDEPAAAALDRVQNELGAGQAGVTVIVDRGEGGNVLDPDGIRIAQQITDAIRADDALDEVLAPDSPISPSVVSYATPVLEVLDDEDMATGRVDDEEAAAGIDAIYGEPGVLDRVGRLLSADPEADRSDGDRDDGVAFESRAGLVNVKLLHELDEPARIDAGLAIRELVGSLDVDDTGTTVAVFSDGILNDDLQGAMNAEIPLLVGLSLIVIVVVLMGALRKVTDVLIALAAIALALVWVFGAIGVLGPRVLGITGGFSQLAVAVPVMLIGLGVDYAFHLTGRYREEIAGGASPEEAVEVPPRTVGRALVLVTATTVIGFLANLVSPLPPIVDFAIYMAAGITGVLVVFMFFVPSVRFLLDRHKDLDRSAGDVPISGRPGAAASLMSGAASLAARAPAAVLAVTLLVAGAGVIGGLRLDTEFNQEQFIPDDTDAGTALVLMQELFGGEVTERSHVVVDADLTDPAALDALLVVGQRLESSAHVVGGPLAVTSPAHLVERLHDTGRGSESRATPDPELVELADRIESLGWSDDEGFDAEADIDGIFEVVEVVAAGPLAGVMNADRTTAVLSVETRAGEEAIDELVADADEAIEPLRAVGAEATFTTLQLVVDETLDALVSAQTEKIVLSTFVAMVVLVVYFGLAHRHPLVGFITIVPTLVAVPAVLGAMWLVGLSFNALTATVAAIAIGFGVDYGIHLSNRFLEERERNGDAASALEQTVTHSGTALSASALTTAGAFGVLVLFGELEPVRQFGAVTAMIMVLALLGTLFAQSSCLALWDRRLRRRDA